MRRHAIGMISITLLLGAVWFLIWPPDGAAAQQLETACRRVGLLMGALWLAYPQLYRLPNWLWTALPVLVVILAFRPRWLLLAVPLIIVLAILKPRLGARKNPRK